MASHYYGVNEGEHEEDVVDSTSTTSKYCEIVVDLTKFTSRNTLLQALHYIVRHIETGQIQFPVNT